MMTKPFPAALTSRTYERIEWRNYSKCYLKRGKEQADGGCTLTVGSRRMTARLPHAFVLRSEFRSVGSGVDRPGVIELIRSG